MLHSAVRHFLAFILAVGAIFAADEAPKIGDFPIWITLDKPKLVTVVIEDAAGVRVRNLVAEMQLPAGKNRLSWDGYDDGKRNADGDLVRQLVSPGSYRARGLTHDGFTLTYEFTVYSGGNPPWPTKDRTGGWLADHSCPLGAVFLPAKSGSPYGDGAPQVLLTALVAEAGSPLVWVGLDGQTLQRRQVWGWDGAIAAARDAGKGANPDIYAYLLMAWEDRITIRGLKPDGTGMEVVSYKPATKLPREPRHEALTVTVQDGLLVFTSPTEDALIVADVGKRAILGRIPIPKPTGLQFDTSGRLLAISEGKILRLRIRRPAEGSDGSTTIVAVEERQEVVGKGLENPRSMVWDPSGKELYVADWGKSHQVKVFSPDGKLLRAIGKPNDGFQLGLYDEQKMQSPLGMAIDTKGQLWVAEATHLPKRISLWNAKTGAFLRAHYGPPRYGGGGTIDPTDKTRLFYQDYYGLMEFALDWKTGTAKPKAICVNAFAGGTDIVAKYGIEYSMNDKSGPSRWGFVGERPVKIGGRTYITNFWQSGLRSSSPGVTWLLGDDSIARPVSRVGSPSFNWPPQLNATYWSISKADGYGSTVTVWTDRNRNSKVEANEWDLRDMPGTWTDADGNSRKVGGLVQEIVHDDLSVTTNWGLRVPPPTIDANGLPIYDLSKAEYIVPHDPMFFYDEQFNWGVPVLTPDDGWQIAGLTGWRSGRKLWSYPRASDAPPARGGDLSHPTRLLGPPAKAAAGEAGQWFAWNGEKGNMYMLTTDGLFLQTLGGDMRTTPLLRFPKAERGMIIDRPEAHVSFEDEHFHPTITTTTQGEVYLVAGKEHSSIFRVDGFASVKRGEFGAIALDAATLAKLPKELVVRTRRQEQQRLAVEITGNDAPVDGQVGEYNTWVTLGSDPVNVPRQASLRVGDKRLYAAFRTGDPACLANSGGDVRFLFKRGGCVDLMIATNPEAERSTGDPQPGDLRLLVTSVNGATKAVLYRAVVPGTAAKDRVLFESPVGQVWFDSVTEVSADVTLVQKGGDIEFSVPLKTLGLETAIGREIRGDLGLLRGDGTQTIQRLYWNNLDTLIVSDIPSEARLRPGNWGVWHFIPPLPKTTLPAVTVQDPKPGLRFAHHAIGGDKLQDLSARTPANTGVVQTPSLKDQALNELLKNQYHLEFTGFVRVPRDGVWTFKTISDDGSRLWIGDTAVVDNDGSHGMVEASGMVRLAAGLHPIRIAYFQGGGGAGLEVIWSGPGTEEQRIPTQALVYAAKP